MERGRDKYIGGKRVYDEVNFLERLMTYGHKRKTG